MNDCTRCNGASILAIRGDETDDCPDCKGTGTMPQVAVQEALSDVARLRLELAALDEAYDAYGTALHSLEDNKSANRLTEAWRNIEVGSPGKFRMLLNAYDALVAENAKLQNFIDRLTS